jgi:hypothetical protein
MHFEGRLASGHDDICNFFTDFIQRTYAADADDADDPGPAFEALQSTVDEVQIVLLELDVNKGVDGIPLIILKNCAFAFVRPLSLHFNRSLSTCVFPDRWKLFYMTLIFKKGKRNNVEDYRGEAYIICNSEAF